MQTETLIDILNNTNEISSKQEIQNNILMLIEKNKLIIEHLYNICISIREFGLSKGVIKAVDPDGYLSTNGIIPAYEELNDLPTKDEKSEIAIEGLIDTIKKSFNNLFKNVKKAIDNISSIIKSNLSIFKSYKEILIKLKKTLNNADINIEKLNSSDVKIISYPDFLKKHNFLLNKHLMKYYDIIFDILNSIGKDLSKNKSRFENYDQIVEFANSIRNKINKHLLLLDNPDLKKYYGLTVLKKYKSEAEVMLKMDNEDNFDPIFGIKILKPTFKPSKMSFKKTKWSKDNINDIINEQIKTINNNIFIKQDKNFLYEIWKKYKDDISKHTVTPLILDKTLEKGYTYLRIMLLDMILEYYRYSNSVININNQNIKEIINIGNTFLKA